MRGRVIPRVRVEIYTSIEARLRATMAPPIEPGRQLIVSLQHRSVTIA